MSAPAPADLIRSDPDAAAIIARALQVSRRDGRIDWTHVRAQVEAGLETVVDYEADGTGRVLGAFRVLATIRRLAAEAGLDDTEVAAFVATQIANRVGTSTPPRPSGIFDDDDFGG